MLRRWLMIAIVGAGCAPVIADGDRSDPADEPPEDPVAEPEPEPGWAPTRALVEAEFRWTPQIGLLTASLQPFGFTEPRPPRLTLTLTGDADRPFETCTFRWQAQGEGPWEPATLLRSDWNEAVILVGVAADALTEDPDRSCAPLDETIFGTTSAQELMDGLELLAAVGPESPPVSDPNSAFISAVLLWGGEPQPSAAGTAWFVDENGEVQIDIRTGMPVRLTRSQAHDTNGELVEALYRVRGELDLR